MIRNVRPCQYICLNLQLSLTTALGGAVLVDTAVPLVFTDCQEVTAVDFEPLTKASKYKYKQMSPTLDEGNWTRSQEPILWSNVRTSFLQSSILSLKLLV